MIHRCLICDEKWIHGSYCPNGCSIYDEELCDMFTAEDIKPFTLRWYECLQERCGTEAYLADIEGDYKKSVRMHTLNGYIDERINRQHNELINKVRELEKELIREHYNK